MEIIVSCETERYIQILRTWNGKINLISSLEKVHQFIHDSVCLSTHIKDNETVVDIGSGNGFPGVILLLMKHKVTMIERDKRKTAFLRNTLTELDLTGRILNMDCGALTEKFDCLVCKGFSSIKEIIRLCKHLSARFLLIKGRSCVSELREALSEFSFSVEIHPISGEDNGCIIEVWNVKNV